VPVKVREAVKQIEAAGWELAAHARQPSPVPASGTAGTRDDRGKPSDTLHPKTWASIIKQAGIQDQ
jgi:predicted RNA binding protein YcfA (HicA-like mRNA interferase family)